MLHRARRIRDLFIPGVFALLILITLICVLAGCGTSSGGTSHAPAGTPAATSSVGAGGRDHPDDGLATVRASDLPAEARATMGLIETGGPFPYHQDGSVFQNRERLLPRESAGYYHEYTVRTRGSADRGARRIITARDGTLYYTADHYDSFRRIVP